MSRMSVIGDLIEQHKWTLGVELGVFQGATFGYLLERCPDLVMYGFDHWRPRNGLRQNKETGETSNSFEEMTLAKRKAYAVAEKYPDRANLIYCTSDLGATYIKGKVDFVFIDADHTTEAVKQDIGVWRYKLRERGALIGHDFNWPSVRRAVDSTLGIVTHLPDNLWVWYTR